MTPEAACDHGKAGYPTRNEARRMIKLLRKKGGVQLKHYRCPRCRLYYLTKQVNPSER